MDKIYYPIEEWRSIEGYEGLYEVSSEGNFRSKDRTIFRASDKPRPVRYKGKSLKLTTNKHTKYLYVMLSKGDKRTAHSVVCEAFHGPRPTPEHQTAHEDGVRSNCRASNLRWATRKENQADKIKHGTANRGERCNWSKLTAEQVADIRSKSGDAHHYAAKYGITHWTVRRLWRGVSWENTEC